ncbi:MAG: hypothetical protein HYV18_09890 [Gammaproteobacteria bacterium]|nr:hypothetical protein [Gammaproteobacteria bacterium]
MPVSMPPPLPPAQLPPAQIRISPEDYVFHLYGYRIRVAGAGNLEREEIAALFVGAANLSDVVQRISQLIYENGALNSQVYYALVDHDLYVLCAPRPIAGVRGDPRLRPYFAELTGARRVNAERFEPLRVMASAYSERAGYAVEPRFVQTPSGRLMLDLDAEPTAAPRMRLGLRAGNIGNRYVGENLVDLSLDYATTRGTELQAVARAAPPALNGGDAGRTYREASLAANAISPHGFYGATARWMRYEHPESATRGQLVELGASWTSLLSASERRRLIQQARLGLVQRSTEASAGGELLFAESYAVAEWTPSFVHMSSRGPWDTDIQLFASAAKGFPAGGTPITQADLDFISVRPGLRVQVAHDRGTRHGAAFLAQFTGDRMPEQQQWALGGPDTLAAYLPGTLAGDGGGLVRLHGEYPVAGRRMARLTFELFGEYGYAQSIVDRRRNQAADAGAALRLQLGRGLDLRAIAAVPLAVGADPSLQQQRAGGFFSLGVRF